MKKTTNFTSAMDFITTTNDLMNYEIQTSNSNNYGLLPQTPSPNSIPTLMENGVIVKFESVKFSTEIADQKNKSEEE